MKDKLKLEISEILINTCDVDPDKLDLDVNLISDLGIDSIDFLDATYDIDRKYNIKLPIEDWMEKVNSGEAELEDYFVMENFVSHVSALIV